MDTFAERLDVASGARAKFEPDRIVLQDRGGWIADTHVEVWESGGHSELPETVLYLHGIVINHNIAPTEVRFAGGPPIAGASVPGRLAVLPAGLAYRGVGWAPTRITVMGLKPQVLAAAVRTRSARPVELKPAYGVADSFIEEALGALARDVREGSPMGNLYGDSIIAAVAAHRVRHHTADPRIEHGDPMQDEGRRSRIRQHILDQLGSQLTLQDLSASLDLDLYSFNRWFKREFGVSAHRYVVHARVERAKHLLQRSTTSLAEVAIDCGFSSQSHMTSVFKRYVRLTPAAFRAVSKGSAK